MKWLKWLWLHWGWGGYKWHPERYRVQIFNPDRQAIKAYCIEHGITRKQAIKGFRKAKMWRRNWTALRKARYDAHKAGRVYKESGPGTTPGSASK